MTDELKAEREAFESWAGDHGYPLNMDKNGDYSSYATDHAWSAWKARAKLDRTTCSTCNGSGAVTANTYGFGPDDVAMDISCPSCGGTGEIDPTHTTGGDGDE